MNGIDVLEKIRGIDESVMSSCFPGMETQRISWESVRRGAAEFINKPFDVREVEIHIRSVLEKRKLKAELSQLQERLRETQKEALIGDSPSMHEVKSLIEEVADSISRSSSGANPEPVKKSWRV